MEQYGAPKYLAMKEMGKSTNLTYDEALEEVIADSCESFILDLADAKRGAQISQQLKKENPTLWDRIKDALYNILQRVRNAYRLAKPQSREAQIIAQMKDIIEPAYQIYVRGYTNAARNLRNMEKVSDKGTVKYMSRVSANDAIKTQLNNHQNEVNAMDVVANVTTPTVFTSKKAAREWAITELKSTGYKVDRRGFGIITFNAKQINRALNYLDDNEEFAAFAVLPKVLKKGIEVSGHNNHKGRGYDTITFAAPVIINGAKGNMAVVVKKNTGDNNYRMHRLLTPSGGKFSFEDVNNKKETATKPSGATDTVVTPTIGSVSNGIITDNALKSNTSKQKNQSRTNGYDFGSFDIGFGEEEIEDTLAREFETHHEDIGEVLRNTADIDITAAKVNSIVNRIIKNNLGEIDSKSRELLSLEIQIALDQVNRKDAEAVTKQKEKNRKKLAACVDKVCLSL